MSEFYNDYISKLHENTFKTAVQLHKKYLEDPHANLINSIKKKIIHAAYHGYTEYELCLNTTERTSHEILECLFLEGFQIAYEWNSDLCKTFIKIKWSEI